MRLIAVRFWLIFLLNIFWCLAGGPALIKRCWMVRIISSISWLMKPAHFSRLIVATNSKPALRWAGTNQKTQYGSIILLRDSLIQTISLLDWSWPDLYWDKYNCILMTMDCKFLPAVQITFMMRKLPRWSKQSGLIFWMELLIKDNYYIS